MKKIWIFIVFMFIICGVVLSIKHGGNKYDFAAKSILGDVTLKSFGGKAKVVYFGYGSCPDVCPGTLAIVSGVLNELKTKDVVVLFVTLDPERDGVKAMDEYAKYFYPNSYGLVADNLDVATKAYGVKFQKVKLEKSAMDYSVAHSSALYMLDRNGKFIGEVTNLTKDNIKEAIIRALN